MTGREDCLTWNVFRSLQEARCLRDVLRLITGLSVEEEPLLYLWGLSVSDDLLEPWDLLLEARKRFESRLPVKRPATEPDVALYVPRRALALIECKLGSPNTFYLDGPRRDNQSLTKKELIEIYRDPACPIIDAEKARQADRAYYQLFRNTQFASYMAHLAGPGTLAFHANLVRAGCEHESTGHFRRIIRPEFADRFSRITWEQLYTVAGMSWRRLSRLIEYLAAKTLNLRPAFRLDLW